MVTKWTHTIPKVSGYYWVTAFDFKGQVVKPEVLYLSDEDLERFARLIPGMLLYSDKKLVEPLWEKY